MRLTQLTTAQIRGLAPGQSLTAWCGEISEWESTKATAHIAVKKLRALGAEYRVAISTTAQTVTVECIKAVNGHDA